MKKYLFLFFLLVIYFVLLLFPKTETVLSYDEKEFGIVNVVIDFKNGINSNDLKLFFDNYDYDYKVLELNINDKNINVSCTYFSKCINDIYKFEDNEFSIKHLVNGFKINKVYFISDKETIENYLKDKNMTYKIW